VNPNYVLDMLLKPILVLFRCFAFIPAVMDSFKEDAVILG
jgi:hypothetical protein